MNELMTSKVTNQMPVFAQNHGIKVDMRQNLTRQSSNVDSEKQLYASSIDRSSFRGTQGIASSNERLRSRENPQRQAREGSKAAGNFIEQTYDQWNKFENFLKFATKKEVRDRLREFDAPDLANYVDPDTIDKINKSHKAPIFKRGQNPKSKEKSKDNSAEV